MFHVDDTANPHLSELCRNIPAMQSNSKEYERIMRSAQFLRGDTRDIPDQRSPFIGITIDKGASSARTRYDMCGGAPHFARAPNIAHFRAKRLY